MLEKVREFLKGPAGKATAGIGVVICLVLMYLSLRSNLGNDLVASSRTRIYIDAETGKTFNYDVMKSPTLGVPAPSGKNSGYPAEACFWNKDGSIRTDPYYVLLNVYVKKPGPTFCPDCGRLVVDHNPLPVPGDQPPPTKAEYKPPSRNE